MYFKEKITKHQPFFQIAYKSTYLCPTLQLEIYEKPVGIAEQGCFFRQGIAGNEKSSTFAPGEMAEWSIAAVLKTVDRLRGPGVRIPLSPPKVRRW